MTRATRAIFAMIVVSAISAAQGYAQQAPSRFTSAQDTTRIARGGWSHIRVAKWSAAFASSAAVAYGIIQNRDADQEYEEIERLCVDDEAACIRKAGDEEYADPVLAARYNSVVRRDDRAELALLAGQIGLAASVLLFIMDLPQGTSTNDIPYDPSPFRLGMRPKQVDFGVHFTIR